MKQSLFNNLIFWCVFIAIAALFYHRMIFLLPQGIHEWAQADRLALAMQFYDRGLNFFKPATYNLSSIEGVTGVEFPIQSYLAALLGVIFGRDNINTIFRLITIAITLIGCFYLYKLMLKKTGSIIVSLFPPVFFICSPVITFYTGTYLPDTASASLVFVALYFLYQFYEKRILKFLLICVAVFTLAMLIKTTSIIYFLSGMGFLILWSYLQENSLNIKLKISLLLGTVFGLSTLVLYTLYNKYINEKYQSSLFLADVKPIQDSEMYNYIIDRVKHLWRYEYFTNIQYLFLALSLILFFVFLKSNIKRNLALTSVAVISFIGAALFFKFMGAQLIDHDYYVIASFYPLIIILVILFLCNISLRIHKRLYWEIGLVISMLAVIVSGYTHLQLRLADKYKGFSDYYFYSWMQGGADAMSEIGSDLNDKIIVLSDYQPNLALVYFDRRGIVWHPETFDEAGTNAVIQTMKDRDLDYAIIKAKDYKESTDHYPVFKNSFMKVIERNGFVVLKPKL